MNYIQQRRSNLTKFLKDDGVDTYLITNPVNVTYLTGFTGDSSAIIINGKHTILVSDARFEDQIAEECQNTEVHIRPHFKTLHEAIAEVLAKTGAKNVGVEGQHMTLDSFELLKAKCVKQNLASTPARVEGLRSIKDPSEVEAIRAAIQIAERAFGMFTAMIRESDTEKQLVDALDSFIRRAGARGSAFPPIVAVGERGALPHAPPTNRPITEGSKLLVDWGADLLYKSDLTRTLLSPFGTAPTRRNKHERVGFNFEKLYTVVQKAQEAAANTVRHGVPAKDVDAAARKVITDAGYGDFFTHGLGHGIGLEVHEAPRIRMNSEDILEAGMVITLEPGIYIGERVEGKTKDKFGGWGGVRLEDNYLVTKDGAKRLTSLPHNPNAIG